MCFKTVPVAVLSSLLVFGAWSNAQSLAYPDTSQVDHIDVYHEVEVADPYRWLENDVRQSEDVADWVERQNAVTFGYLEKIPDRDAIRARIEKLWDYERFSVPRKAGNYYYFFRNDGLQNQSVLYRQRSFDAEPVAVLDPNTWSADGTVAMGGMAYSPDGRYLAYGVNEAGSDWATWRVFDLETLEELTDRVRWVKYSGAEWTQDNKGFFYGRFDEPKPGSEFQNITLGQKIYYHAIGNDQSEDELVYARPDEPSWGFGLDVSDDGAYLVLSTWRGTDSRNRVSYRDLRKSDSEVVDLIANFDNEYAFLGNDGPLFYFKTDLDAPNGRVIGVDIENPVPKHWSETVPERAEALQWVSLVGNQFLATYLKDAKSEAVVYAMDGAEVRRLDLPGIGSIFGFGGERNDGEVFYQYSSFSVPPKFYRYDVNTGESTVVRSDNPEFDSEKYETRQIFYTSADGTRVPMFITHAKGLVLDTSHRVLLYGYGGFNIPMVPAFSASRAAWLELGGVYAVANLRGGGEYGLAWHDAGKKLNKQNVFDDFIAAAEWLIANGYTKPDNLIIQGRSNGGLLVGAAMTQRPDLFGVCLPAVGVMDMLRFHRFTAGRFWVDDYGAADDPEEFKALFAYSPYHNLRPGTDYPPTLITTADTDDRVVPGHSFKFAARLQEVQAGSSPVLIRIETRAGHGAGKPTSKRIEELTDEYAFAIHHTPLDQ